MVRLPRWVAIISVKLVGIKDVALRHGQYSGAVYVPRPDGHNKLVALIHVMVDETTAEGASGPAFPGGPPSPPCGGPGIPVSRTAGAAAENRSKFQSQGKDQAQGQVAIKRAARDVDVAPRGERHPRLRSAKMPA